MSRQWPNAYRLFVKCVRGLEGALENELLSLGFPRNCLIRSRSGITIEEGSLRKLYFVSYFSRLCSGVFVEGVSFPVKDKASFTESCAGVSWKDFLRPDSSFLVDARITGSTSFLHSSLYACQLAKDGISHYFGRHLGRPTPTISLRNPDVKLLLHIDSGESRVLIDAVGAPTSSRRYRYKSDIDDINPTVAVALLHDMGFTSPESNPFSLQEYEGLCSDLGERSSPQSPKADVSNTTFAVENEEHTRNVPRCGKGDSVAGEETEPSQPYNRQCHENTTPNAHRYPSTRLGSSGAMINLFSGCGTFLIEAAMIAARIAPGTLFHHFGFQNFGLYDATSFNRLVQYASEMRLSADSTAYRSLQKKFIGIESNWAKVEASLYSADKAGVMDLIRIIQSDYLKDGLYDAYRDRTADEHWRYLIAQMPKLKARFNTIPDSPAESPSDDDTVVTGPVNIGNSSEATLTRKNTRSQITNQKQGPGRKPAASLLDPSRYYKLANNIGKFRKRLFEPDTNCLLVVPSVVQLAPLEDAFGGDLRGGRHFMNGGLPCTVYHSRHDERSEQIPTHS